MPSVQVPHVSPLMAYGMVRASPVAAILVGSVGPPRLDVVLRYVQALHQGMVCWVDIDEIDLADNATRSWIDAQHAQMGRPAGASVRPGYYLFRDGQVWAYSSGLIVLPTKNERHDPSLGPLCQRAMHSSEAAAVIKTPRPAVAIADVARAVACARRWGLTDPSD